MWPPHLQLAPLTWIFKWGNGYSEKLDMPNMCGLWKSPQAWPQASLVHVRSPLLYCPLPEAGWREGTPKGCTELGVALEQ